MKPITVLTLALILTLASAVNVGAQAAESIWLTASTTAYKTGETVIVAVNAVSATPIQGFTFQIRYDPGCLRPVNAASIIPGMNGLPLPQLSGLVDGSYASTTPQTVNGILAEIRFTALGGCQTNLTLESAALAVRNESGFAAPLAGVMIGETNVALNIDKTVTEVQATQPVSGSVLPLTPPESAGLEIPGWAIGLSAILLVLGVVVVIFKLFRAGLATNRKAVVSSGTATLHVKRGSQAGKSFVISKSPCLIGRDPTNDICLNDSNVIGQHVKILSRNNGYYLMDLGGETFINGRPVQKSSAMLKPGDVVRLGKSTLFVFG